MPLMRPGSDGFQGLITIRQKGAPTRQSASVTGVSGTTFTLRNATTNAQTAGVVSYDSSTFGAGFKLNVMRAAKIR